MQGFGVDINAPEPPFVLFKVLWRCPLGSPFRAVWLVISVLARFVASIAAYVFGIEEPHPRVHAWQRQQQQPSAGDASATPWLPQDLSMMGDEYI